jgi:phosphatidate phosphatase APP1
LGPTEANGHLRAELRLQPWTATQATTSFWLDYAAVLPPDDDRTFQGESLLVAPEGLSVISDIDDTIKITEVTDQEALLANTFLKPFEAVPGMADAYQRLAAAQAAFHYVSSSPWQLYPLLSDFMQSSAFPRGSFHLRNFRLKDETLLNVFKSSHETKPPVIEGLLRTYPKREFILIGDSGEADPEIYGDIARRHPGRIRHIYIRRVPSEPSQSERYRTAFAGLPESLWTLFEDAAAISP